MRALLIFSCWTLLAVSPVNSGQTEPEEALALRRIIDFWEEGEYQIAKNQMEDFLAEFPENPYSDTLRAALGDLFLREKSYQIALNYYAQVTDPALVSKAFPNRMQCLYHLEWHATLADECEAYLQSPSESLEDERRLEATYFLAIALYQQCLTQTKDESAVQALAERAKPYFESLSSSEQSDEVAEAFAHLRCLLKDFEGASKIYVDLSRKNGDSSELLFQAALIQSKYDKALALETFAELASQANSFARDAAYNQLVLSFDLDRHEEITAMQETILASVPEERIGLSHLYIGRSFLALHQYREASLSLGKFLDSAVEPSTIRPGLLHLLDAAYRAEDVQLVDEAIVRLQRFDPQDAELANALFSKAQLLKKKDQTEEAKAELRSLLAQFPQYISRPLVRFEVVQLEADSKQWTACREMAHMFLQEYPTHELSPLAWRHFAAASIELAAQTTECKQQCAQDLESLLKEGAFLSASERLDFQFHLAKVLFELGSREAAAACLHAIITEPVDFEQRANAELLFALASSENRDLFCTWAELALSHRATLLPIADQHLALFNAYAGDGPEPVSAAQAAEHLYAAFEAKATIQLPNLLWLANYTYEHRKENILQAERSLAISAHVLDNNPEPICQETLSLESLTVHAAELHWQLGRPSVAIALLEGLNEQYKDKSLSWTAEKETKLYLAEWMLESGNRGAAECLFDELSSSAVLRDPFTAKAALQNTRLKREHEHPDYTQILSILKNLVLQKNLQNEPIHLEAALDYIEIQSERHDPEQKGTKRLRLLTKTKTDFEAKEDLLSKDYHAARDHLAEKNKIYLSYMNYLDSQILLTQAELESDPNQQKELQAKAKDILLQIKPTAPTELRTRLENNKSQ